MTEEVTVGKLGRGGGGLGPVRHALVFMQIRCTASKETQGDEGFEGVQR
jgi:hypothetical protein